MNDAVIERWLRCTFTMGRVILLGTWLVSSAVRAADAHPPISIDIERCVPADGAEVRRLVALELRGDPLPTGPQARGATQVMVGCEQGKTSLRVDDPLTGKQLQRTLQLVESDPRARTRLLALSIVELVVASWTELTLDMPNGEARTTTAEDDSQRKQAVQTVRRYTPSPRSPSGQIGFGASVSLSLQPRGVDSLWRAAGHAVYMVRPVWETTFSLERSGTTIERAPGSTEVSVWAAGLGTYFAPRWSSLSMRAGPEVRFGRASLNPRAEEAAITARDVRGPVLDVGLFVGGRLHLRRSALLAGLQAAVTCVGVRGRISDAPDVRYRGLMMGASLGIEVWP